MSGKELAKVAFLLVGAMFILNTASAETYGGASVGNGTYDIDFPSTEHGYDSESGQSLSLLIGKDDLELEYSHLGTYSIRNDLHETSATIQTVSVSYVPKLGWAFFKVGYEGWRISASFDGHPEAVYGSGLVYGLGVHFKLKNGAYLRIGADRHSVSDERVNDSPGILRAYSALIVRF